MFFFVLFCSNVWWAVEELKQRALERYASVKGAESEQLVSGSDDFTLFLWKPGESRKPVARMTGEGGWGLGVQCDYMCRSPATYH